jgi:chromosomal replication initiation ATPase DnaA
MKPTTTTPPEDTITTQCQDLERRKSDLQKLLQLRREVQEMEAELLTNGSCRNADLQLIVVQICRYYQIEPAQISYRDRTAHIVRARHAIFYFLRVQLNMPLEAIGRAFHRDHSAVHYGVRQTINHIATEPGFKAEIDAVKIQIITAAEGQRPRIRKPIAA